MASSLFSIFSFLLLIGALISPSFNQIIGGSKLGDMTMAIQVEDSMALLPFGSTSGIGSFSRTPQCGGPRRTIANAAAIGVCYGSLGDNLPESRDVVQLYKSYGIKRMRIYDPKEDILNALRDSNIELVVSIPNMVLQSLATLSTATNWVQRYIQAYMPRVEFRYIAVGNYNESFASYVLPAMRSIYNVIAAANLQDQIKVSTVISDGLLASSSPPSLASFTSEAREFIEPILSFLAENGSPLLVNLYPYYTYINSPQSISLDYALFTASQAVLIDGKFEYRNLFETILDALYAALEKSGGANVPIVVSESGWPSSGANVVATSENAGTYTSFETDGDGHFKYCFMAVGSSIEGWKYCRPNISVDGTFLKGKFVGTLLTASTLDGNNQIFPLAFGIVDSENDASWKWFFENIKNSLGDREGLVIVSDRHLSIPKGALAVFPTVEYCVCIQHLLRNMKSSYKDPLLDKIFFLCAKAYTVDDFELNMRWMELIHPTIREYLNNVGFE